MNHKQNKKFSTLTLFIWKILKKYRTKSYVGTDESSGAVQIELLKKEGCIPTSTVLEIGCGTLHLGLLLIDYLDEGNYVGIDPNEWLRVKILKRKNVINLIKEKQVTFLNVTDFDASKLGRKFDFIFSHSVLSHCAYWQLDQYLQNTSKVLSRNGKILSSIRLAEGNDFGSTGSEGRIDSMEKEWVYPGSSWFKLDTVKQFAKKYNLSVDYKPYYTEYYTKTKPKEFHDWLIFTKDENLIT